ncbi:MarR family transcriptional regulator [Agromyces sp. CFH 90414]|uniref:MarR family transcriptional regulator n=1 Tax=Agromyces agglutinans TaxID=2662258 RepID=A0A6I2FJ39_9MICO|nr:MarR family transcriptional regulator [Agromyces agglutinans]MRG60728.1 MarR family transcriptional regulator [Agromyces agglutinans]
MTPSSPAAGAGAAPDAGAAPRSGHVAAVLEAVTLLGRAIAAERRTPFEGRSLTRSQMETLFLLAHDAAPVTPGRVAERLGLTAGAVTQLVDGLKHEGLVDTARHPEDARSRILRLTDGAARQVARFEADTVARLSPSFDRLRDDELVELARLLRAVTEGEH